MHRLAPFLAASAMLLFVSTACSGSSTPTPTTAAPTTTEASTTTTVVSTTIPAPELSGASSSADAANELVSAWNAHDRVAAGHIAVPDAVEGIFATPDPAMWMRGCTTDDALGEGGCIYLTEKGAVQVNTEKRVVGWVVTSAQWGER